METPFFSENVLFIKFCIFTKFYVLLFGSQAKKHCLQPYIIFKKNLLQIELFCITLELK